MDYNTIDFHTIKGVFQSLSREIKKFIKEKPKQKFVFDLLLGVSASGSLHLSKIARTLNEKIKITKTITRLSRNLIDCDEEIQNQITEMYNEKIKKHVTDDTIFAVDDSDISKRHSKKLEDLGTVRDGSTGEKCVKGYHLAEIVALTAHRKEPFAVASKIYSNKSEDFKSQNDEWVKLFDKITLHNFIYV